MFKHNRSKTMKSLVVSGMGTNLSSSQPIDSPRISQICIDLTGTTFYTFCDILGRLTKLLKLYLNSHLHYVNTLTPTRGVAPRCCRCGDAGRAQ